MSEHLSAEERETLADWLRSPDGCWEGEECCWTSFDAMVPAVERILTARLASRDARLAAVEALAGGYHEDAQCEVLAMPASLARRAVYLRVSGDISAALHPDPSEASTDA